jgi:hypothetical protein
MKKGSLHKALKIPASKRIPTTLLTRIHDARQNSIVKNPTKTGKRRIKATGCLKKKVNFALNVRK